MPSFNMESHSLSFFTSVLTVTAHVHTVGKAHHTVKIYMLFINVFASIFVGIFEV